MDKYSVYLPVDRLIALGHGDELPDRTWGAALFADISGFTPLTEALVREFGPQRGAEEITHYLNKVYDALISCLHRFDGTVISFAGDAITCWFDHDDGLGAAACALCMQDEIKQFAVIKIQSNRANAAGLKVSLAIKVAIATGPARRLVVGDPNIQFIDVLGGSTLYHLANTEHHAEKGEIILDTAAVEALGQRAEYSDWRIDSETGEKYGILKSLHGMPDQKQLSILSDHDFKEGVLKPWLLPPIYQRLHQGQGEFLAELRPALALFLNFKGIDFDEDESAGEKLNAYMIWAQKILAHYDAYIFQLIVGDKGNYLYAAFGAPVAHEDDAIRAVSAGLDLLARPEEFNYIKDIKIGITRGRLHTGAYGSARRRTYGMLGDEVNLAARLMQAAAPGQILTNLAVKQSTGNFFRWESLAEIRVKGKAESIAVFSPLGLQPRQAMRLRTLNYALPMVGRENELKLIDGKIQLAKHNQGQVIGIMGEAGIGKSRLASELILRADDAGFYYYDGECQSYAIDSSYWVWQSIWRSIFKLDSAQSTAEQIENIEAFLNSIDSTLITRVPLLGALMNLPIPENNITANLDAKLRKSSLEALLVDCLRTAAQSQPMVIVLENCQWMDALSHDLAEALGRAARELPVLIVLIYRPLELERLKQARISRLPNFTELSLSEFSQAQAYHLIFWKFEQLGIRQGDIPTELVDRIITQAQGNPFYIEELINYLHDQNLYYADPHTLSNLELPNSLHSLILSRVDQLTDTQQITLKVASVIGRLFQAALLWGMYPDLGQPDQVESDLEKLSTFQLTAQDLSEPELTYFFIQIVTQQVAYETLPYATRAMLHNQLALFIEKNVKEMLPQYVDLLAFHYIRGENWPKALDYNLQAAQNNQRRYANEAAITACQNALQAAVHLTVKDVGKKALKAFEILSEVQTLLGRYDEALANYAKAKSMVELQRSSVAQKNHLAELCRKTSEIYERRSEFDKAQEWLRTGLTMLEETNALNIEAAMIHLVGAGIYRRQGKFDDAIAWCEKSLEIARQLPGREPQRVIARAFYNLGDIYNRQGNSQQAIQYCEQSREIYEQIEDAIGVAAAINNLGVVLLDIGDYEKASLVLQKSLEINQKIGDIQQTGFIVNNLGNIFLYRGEWDKAAENFTKSNRTWKQLGAAYPDAVTLGNLAQVFIYQHRFDEAQSALAQVQKLLNELGAEGDLSELERRWSELRLKRGELDEAFTHIQRSIELATGHKDRLEEGKSRRVLGEVLLAQNRLDLAELALAISIDFMNELNSKYEAARATASLARVELAQDKKPEALSHLEQARKAFEELGAQYYVAEVDKLKQN